jgi:hypothetical protein
MVASGCTYTITEPFDVSNGLTEITGNIRISAPSDATIVRDASAEDDFRIFSVSPDGELSLHHITVRNGSATSGGGILNAGTLTLNSSTLAGNTALFGGGILSNGFVALNDSTLRNGFAEYGGGIAVEGGTTTLNRSRVIANSADDIGGGIYNGLDSHLTLADSTIADNSSKSLPSGGIYNNGTVTIAAGTEITGNQPNNCAPPGSIPGCEG